MKENFQKFRDILKLDEPGIQFRPRIKFSDGFSVSIQANAGAYCSPRNYNGFYYEVELGYPSDIVEDWLEYMEDDFEFADPRQSVYPYVPVDIVFQELSKHGEPTVDSSKFSKALPETLRFYEGLRGLF